MYYLPPDYPFFVESNSEDEIRKALKNAKDMYGSSSWEYGLEVIRIVRERSSNQWVYSEIESMVRTLQTDVLDHH